MNTGKKLTTANLVLVFSILVLVIVVAVPVILIILTAFFENGKFNIAGVMKFFPIRHLTRHCGIPC
jgi:iron(III) transport system permease protein